MKLHERDGFVEDIFEGLGITFLVISSPLWCLPYAVRVIARKISQVLIRRKESLLKQEINEIKRKYNSGEPLRVTNDDMTRLRIFCGPGSKPDQFIMLGLEFRYVGDGGFVPASHPLTRQGP